MDEYDSGDEFTERFDEADETEDQIGFIDYESDGLWVFGIMNPKTKEILDVLDTDEDINTLVHRATETWGAAPEEIQLSDCCATLLIWRGVGMAI